MPDWTDEDIDWYADKHGDHPSVATVTDAIPLGGHEDVLDIGCGTGSALRALAHRTAGRLIGIEPSARMIGHARRATEGVRITFLGGRAEDLPCDDASVDVIAAINSTPHWSDLEKGLGEACRVLRSVGLLVVGGEGFTEPDSAWGQPYRDALTVRGFSVSRHALPGDCFITLARRDGK